MRLPITIISFLLFSGLFVTVFGQSDSQNSSSVEDKNITSNRVIGTITDIDFQNKCLTIETPLKNSVRICSTEMSQFYQMPVNETSLSKAKKINFENIQVGDRSYARGKVSANLKIMPAEYIVIIEAGEIEDKLKADQEKWRKFGKSGFVQSIDKNTKTIVIQEDSGLPEKTISIDVSQENVKFLRYPAGAAQFSDAVSSTFEDIKVGNLVKVLLRNSPASNNNTAEIVVSGHFRTVGGTISSINYEKHEIQLKNITNKEILTIQLGAKGFIKKMSPEITNLMIARTNEKKSSPQTDAVKNQPSKDINEFIEKLPDVSFSELKVGDMLIVSCSGNSPEDTVFKSVLILSKAEQFFTYLQKQGLKTIPNLASMGFGQ